MTTDPAARPTARYALIAELNHEWAGLVARHRDRIPWDGGLDGELAGHEDLAALLAAIRHRPDAILGALLAQSAAGDLLAARTVLQAMLGNVVRLIRSQPDAEPVDVVAAIWCRIRTYPLARRPTRIAANLALDTRKDVVRQLRHDRIAVSRLHADRLLVDRAEADPGELVPDEARRLIDLALRRGIVDAVTAAVLRAVYLDGASSRVAAARLGTSAGMIRYRCSRGVRALSRHAAELIPERLDDAA